jgi:hypothetical protein
VGARRNARVRSNVRASAGFIMGLVTQRRQAFWQHWGAFLHVAGSLDRFVTLAHWFVLVGFDEEGGLCDEHEAGFLYADCCAGHAVFGGGFGCGGGEF